MCETLLLQDECDIVLDVHNSMMIFCSAKISIYFYFSKSCVKIINFPQFFFRVIPKMEMVCYLCGMTREERILKFKYPDRNSFTEAEIREVRRLLSADEYKDESAGRLPTRFVAIGDVVSIFGHKYRCVRADKDILTDPCLGCDLRELACSSKVPQWSPFDRRDHKRVWYKRVDG